MITAIAKKLAERRLSPYRVAVARYGASFAAPESSLGKPREATMQTTAIKLSTINEKVSLLHKCS